MKPLVNTWDPTKGYSELDIIKYGNNIYMVCNPNEKSRDGKSFKVNAGILPIKLRRLSNGLGRFNNTKMIEAILSEYNEVTSDINSYTKI